MAMVARSRWRAAAPRRLRRKARGDRRDEVQERRGWVSPDGMRTLTDHGTFLLATATGSMPSEAMAKRRGTVGDLEDVDWLAEPLKGDGLQRDRVNPLSHVGHRERLVGDQDLIRARDLREV
jgi:hypothetical protein